MNEIFDIVFNDPTSFVIDIVACLSLLCGCVGLSTLMTFFI